MNLKKSFTSLLVLTLLAGCSSNSSSSATAASTTSSTVADQSLVVAIGAQFDTLDPALSTTTTNAYVIDAIYSGLYMRNEDGSTSYDLAESAETSEDGLTWTFKLKEDATFSDGTPITSENYLYAYLRALSYGPDNAFTVNTMKELIVGAEEYSDASYEVDDFDCTTEDHSGVGIETPDDYTLILHLNYPLSYLPIDLAGGSVFSPLPLDTPQHDSSWSLEPGYATCGEYILTEFGVNDKAVLVKDPTCLHADDVLMEKITLQVMTDQDAQYAAYQTGDVDIALSVSTDVTESYTEETGLWVLNTPSSYCIVINSETGPEALKDVNVRKALYMAIDKESLVSVIGGEDLHPILDGWVPFGFTESDGQDFRSKRDAEGYELTYDKEKAIELLNAAGYDENNPLQLTYKYSKNSIHEDVATMLQSMWQALGCVEIEFDAVESGVYYTQIDDGDIEFGRYGIVASDSPMSFLKTWIESMQVVDLIGDDGVYDEMVETAQYIADEDEFMEALHEAEDYLVQEQCFIYPLFQSNTAALVQTNLTGYEIHGASPYFSHCVKN